MKTLVFPLSLLEEAFGNCEVKLERCDDNPSLRNSTLPSDHHLEKSNHDETILNYFNFENVTKILIKNCPYSNFELILVHEKILPTEGWVNVTNGLECPTYFANYQRSIEVCSDKIINEKYDNESEFEVNAVDNDEHENSVASTCSKDTGVNSLKILTIQAGRYKCSGCGFVFTKQSNVKRHQRRTCPAIFGGIRTNSHKQKQSANISKVLHGVRPKRILKFQDKKYKCCDSLRVIDNVKNVETLQGEKCQSAVGVEVISVSSQQPGSKVNHDQHETSMIATSNVENLKVLKVKGKYKCSGCNCILSNFKSAKRHQINTCPARFKIVSALDSNSTSIGVENIISRNGKHQCRFCNRWYSHAENVKTHQIYTCEASPFKKFSSSNLNKNTDCKECNKSFTSKKTLMQHITAVHVFEKPHKCTICLASFSRAYGLTLHMKLHSQERKFGCLTCGKQFERPHSLMSHKLLHSGLQPFVCTTCGRRFRDRSAYRRHVMNHSNERPFKCDSCGKRFGRKFSLNKHMKTHMKGELISKKMKS